MLDQDSPEEVHGRAPTIDEYQKWTISTAKYPGSGEKTAPAIVYVALGLAGEAGETLEKIKKAIRGDRNGVAGIDSAALLVRDVGLLNEMGDVLYYLSRLAAETGFTMTEVMAASVKKLEDRKLHGEGDTR